MGPSTVPARRDDGGPGPGAAVVPRIPRRPLGQRAAAPPPAPPRERGSRAALVLWLLMGAMLMGPALMIGGSRGLARLSDATLAWQAGTLLDEPWRLWSAAWVHLSPDHLLANLVGGLLVLALGWLGQVNRGALLAWALAWPLTHVALLVHAPLLQHYAGLSGVLHAGVAVVAVRLATGRRISPARRRIGLALAAGLTVKLLLEQPWRGPMSGSSEWDFPVVVAAHAWGAGLGGGLALLLARGRR